MVERKEYLQKLWSWKDEQVIKVVTGIRRCGKSTLLKQYQNKLKSAGVTEEQIISINFEELENEPLLDYKSLYQYIKERLCEDKMTYIFLDEIQKVTSFEKVVDSLHVKENIDIYITGSNAYMLSGDLATLLTGRYVEISMLPLSFKEYVEITGILKEQAFSEYMKTGGFPYIAVMDRTDEKVEIYLEGIYNTVIVRDIEDRQSRKEMNCGKRKITDITLLKTIARYLASVIGSPISIKSITNYLISSGRKVSANTVSDYVDALTESFIFCSVDRFDIVGKQLLKVNKKLYMVDLGLMGAMVKTDPAQVLIKNDIFKEYKGGMTEQYVLQQMKSKGVSPIYYHNTDNSRLELDFVIQRNAQMVPIEVKAEGNVRANSLTALLGKRPELHAERFSMLPYKVQGNLTNFPLYAI